MLNNKCIYIHMQMFKERIQTPMTRQPLRTREIFHHVVLILYTKLESSSWCEACQWLYTQYRLKNLHIYAAG